MPIYSSTIHIFGTLEKQQAYAMTTMTTTRSYVNENKPLENNMYNKTENTYTEESIEIGGKC